MEFTTRKSNRLKYYNYSSSGAYFLTVCVKNRYEILCKIVGDGVLDVPKIQLSQYGNIVRKYIDSVDNLYEDINIDKYVIMPNHIHLIIFISGEKGGTSRTPSPTNASIPSVISTLKRFVNKECGFSVFQRSYHDHIIRNEQEYIKIWEYIDTNSMCWEKDCFYPQNI